MIPHRQSRCFLTFFVWVCSLTGVSYGQQLPLPLSIVNSPDPTPNRPDIDKAVDKEVAKLSSSKPSDIASGRNLLIAEAGRGGVSPGFLDQYADSINAKMLSLAKNKDARVRLNAAIIVARVAAKAANGRLGPVTQVLVNDSSDAVVLWGLQSAKYVVPALLLSTNVKLATDIGEDVVGAYPQPPDLRDHRRSLPDDATGPRAWRSL